MKLCCFRQWVLQRDPEVFHLRKSRFFFFFSSVISENPAGNSLLQRNRFFSYIQQISLFFLHEHINMATNPAS